MRNAVTIWTSANAIAALANQAFAAIVVENTFVTASVYAEETSSSRLTETASLTRYDRVVPDYDAWRRRSRARNVGPPLILIAGLSAGIFGLAKLHLARPSTPKAGAIVLGDVYRGETIFSTKCASCHGMGGSGGIGPKLDGDRIPLSLVQSRIANGKGIMPPGLVSGRDESDVLAYVSALIKPPPSQ